MQILQGMPILGFFVGSLATMQRKLILYHENILGCQRNNPRGNVLPSLRSGGLFYPRCARVKQLPPFSSIGKNNFPPLVFLRLPKFFHNTRTSILCLCFNTITLSTKNHMKFLGTIFIHFDPLETQYPNFPVSKSAGPIM